MTIIRVPPEGSLEAKIAIIGEAPGEQEVIEQKPFVGSSGHLLNQLLTSAGILRCDCYLTNVVKERPVDNKISQFITFGRTKIHRTPEYDAYENELYEELASSKANVFIALGQTAFYALTRHIDIVKRRGSLLLCRRLKPDQPERKCIGTRHPSACLRGDYLLRWPILHDLIQAKTESESPELHLPQRRLHVGPSFEEMLAYLARIRERKGKVGFDIESPQKVGEVVCFAFALDPLNAMCFPFTREGGGCYMAPDQEERIWRETAEILEDPSITKVGQNLTFDAAFLHNRYGICMKSMEDTMIAHALLFPDFKKGLDFICSMYTREPYYKDEGKQGNISVQAGGLNAYWLYNAKDAAVTLEAWFGLRADLEKQGNLASYEFQKTLIEPLVFLQENGVSINTAELSKAALAAKEKIKELTAELNKLCGFELNIASPKQMCDYFYNRKGYSAYLNRKTGGMTCDDDALKRLGIKGSKEAEIIRQIRKLETLDSRYYSAPQSPTKRACSAYNPVGGVKGGGRISSSKTIFGWGMNMQNQPPAMRKVLQPDEGWLAFNADLDQAENRFVAYIAPEPTMIRAFETGVDIHRLTATSFITWPDGRPKIVDEISDVPGSSPLGNGKLSERDWGKKANHSLNYDLGPNSFALRFEMPQKQGGMVVNAYHNLYPGIRGNYHRWIREELDRSRTLQTAYGRKRKFYGRRDDELYKAGYACVPQGTIGEKLNRDGVTPLYYQQETFKDVVLLNQVHDSIWFQMRIPRTRDEAITVARLLLRVRTNLERPIPWKDFEVTIPASLKMGFNFQDMVKCDWKKNADEESLAAHLLEQIPNAYKEAKKELPIDEALPDTFEVESDPEYSLEV